MKNVNASITLPAGIPMYDIYGNLVPQINLLVNSAQDYGNGTILFNVNGLERQQGSYVFTVNSYGNGTLNLIFNGTLPMLITGPGSSFTNYVPSWKEVIRYSVSGTNTLILTCCGINIKNEISSIIFGDDFLQKGNGALDSGWTFDTYYSNQSNVPRIFSRNGYMVLSDDGSGVISTVHYSSIPAASYDSSYLNSTQIYINRKLTVSTVPFSNNNATFGTSLKVGFAPLITASINSFPISGLNVPFGTINIDAKDNCNDSSIKTDNYGIEYFSSYNNGTIYAIACSASGRQKLLLGNLNPTLYTVFTIKYSSLNLGNGNNITWTNFRVYQEDSNSKIIFDRSVNMTSGTNPLANKNYVFISLQDYSHYRGYSSIDLVQLQNYGSPVDLRVPLSIPTPIPGTGTVLGLFALLCQWAGFGNIFLGGILIYMVTLFIVAVPVVKVTGNTYPAIVIGIIDTAMFVYSGIFPFYPVMLILIGVAIVAVMIIMKIFAGGSSESGGDASDAGMTGGGIG